MTISITKISAHFLILIIASVTTYHIASTSAYIEPSAKPNHTSIRIGSGDSKKGYEAQGYATDSRAI
ncbi:MAG: hypothetical protein ACI9QV_001048 [Methylophagaceae bacterium]|jgi:hypothetical protein